MTSATATHPVAAEAEALLKTVTHLYAEYLSTLEALIEKVPDTEIETLRDLNAHLKEVHESLEHDLRLFDEAVSLDREELNRFQDQLKIKTLYDQLKNV